MKAMIFFSLLCVSVVSFGANILIKGLPTPLQYNGQLYFLPPDYIIPTSTTDLYVTMDGVNKVCFLNQTSSIMYDRISHINVLMNGMNTEWNCFPYITTIMEVRP